MVGKNWLSKSKLQNMRSPILYSSVLFLCVFVGVLYWSNQKRSNVDWLNTPDWSHFTGAEYKDGMLYIRPTGREINHSDTSTAQPNPPVNVRGPHLKTSGDFRITMELSDVTNGAIAQFYGQVPVIYDEWRQERGSVRIEAQEDEFTVRVWDGTAASSIDQRTYKVNLKDNVELSLVYRADDIDIEANGKILGSIPNHNIFAQGTVWFGADAKHSSNGWVLHALRAEGIGTGSVAVIPSPSLMVDNTQTDTLRSISSATSRQLPIGAAISIGPLMTDQYYRTIALSQFSLMTPENSLKPQFIHPQEDLYAFEEADSLVEAAHQNNMTVHGHALVLGKANPEWIQKTPEAEREKIMINHIRNIVGRYKGKIAQWDVVNEPMSEDGIDYSATQKGMRKHIWSDAMGEEYIDIAFNAARAADPDAKLYLNDFGLEKDGERWEAFISLLERLQAREVPVYGVGFEAHVYHAPADTIDTTILKKHIQQLASMGLNSRISEIDVLGDDPNYQAEQYSDVLKVCLSEPTCTSYGTWGITDLYGSTTLADRYPIMLGDSLLWNEHYSPKSAIESMKMVLRKL